MSISCIRFKSGSQPPVQAECRVYLPTGPGGKVGRGICCVRGAAVPVVDWCACMPYHMIPTNLKAQSVQSPAVGPPGALCCLLVCLIAVVLLSPACGARSGCLIAYTPQDIIRQESTTAWTGGLGQLMTATIQARTRTHTHACQNVSLLTRPPSLLQLHQPVIWPVPR